MNREYNDNKMYNSALDELRFSEEAKSRMVDRLMAAAEQPEQPVAIHRVRRFPRIAAVGVAAALVLSIGAGATGVFKSASDAFAGVFGTTADTEIIDQSVAVIRARTCEKYPDAHAGGDIGHDHDRPLEPAALQIDLACVTFFLPCGVACDSDQK